MKYHGFGETLLPSPERKLPHKGWNQGRVEIAVHSGARACEGIGKVLSRGGGSVR